MDKDNNLYRLSCRGGFSGFVRFSVCFGSLLFTFYVFLFLDNDGIEFFKGGGWSVSRAGRSI